MPKRGRDDVDSSLPLAKCPKDLHDKETVIRTLGPVIYDTGEAYILEILMKGLHNDTICMCEHLKRELLVEEKDVPGWGTQDDHTLAFYEAEWRPGLDNNLATRRPPPPPITLKYRSQNPCVFALAM